MKRFRNFIERFDHRSSAEPPRAHGASTGVGISPMNCRTHFPSTLLARSTGRAMATATSHCEMVSPRSTSSTRQVVNRRWYSADWTDENEYDHIARGEFQSPVWVAISMAIAADRERDRSESGARESTNVTIPGTVHDDRGGELRVLLACVVASRKASEKYRRLRSSSHERTTATYPQFDDNSASESLLYVQAAAILTCDRRVHEAEATSVHW